MIFLSNFKERVRRKEFIKSKEKLVLDLKESVKKSELKLQNLSKLTSNVLNQVLSFYSVLKKSHLLLLISIRSSKMKLNTRKMKCI